MKKPVKIGVKEFQSKKDALSHYKNILNSYKFGQALNEDDFTDLLALLNYEYQISIAQIPHEDNPAELHNNSHDEAVAELDSGETLIEDIIVAKVQFNTKCFEVFYSDGTSFYISYLLMLRTNGCGALESSFGYFRKGRL